jgi:EAL domain-containing protein (putative c-di-GMP-specific phosphodiesterase class I)
MMMYQPQIDLQSGELIGAEALIRWRHPSRGWVSPAEFIPVAEDTGQIIDLDCWVLERSCRDAAKWTGNLHVAVNVSGQQFAKTNLLAIVRKALQSSGLRPERLEVEITETTLMRNPGQAQVILAELRQLGVRIALDDFGTGYSSLAYLATLPLDVLKIDRSFVTQMSENNTVDVIVATILNLGETLGLTTLAEGIEMSDQATHLCRHGCRLGQGFLFDGALAATQIAPHFYQDTWCVEKCQQCPADSCNT